MVGAEAFLSIRDPPKISLGKTDLKMTKEEFDEKTVHELRFYVYALIDPRENKNKVFYIGKGVGNRVFQHAEGAVSDLDEKSAKYDVIRSIHREGLAVKCVIVRHGLESDSIAFEIEAALIDLAQYGFGEALTNQVSGHHFTARGWMTSQEIQRRYNAPPLKAIGEDCVIININRKYSQGSHADGIYEATKGVWAINRRRLVDRDGNLKIKYVLSEFRGLIVEVFSVRQWFPMERGYGKTSKRSGQRRLGVAFEGCVAEENIRSLYINKSIAHVKKQGAAIPHRFNL